MRRRRTEFMYNHTCPVINGNIESIKSALFSSIHELIAEVCPMLPDTILGELATHHSNMFYAEFESNIEAVRDTNSDMRNKAEMQIESLDAEIDSLYENIQALEDERDHWRSRAEDA